MLNPFAASYEKVALMGIIILWFACRPQSVAQIKSGNLYIYVKISFEYFPLSVGMSA